MGNTCTLVGSNSALPPQQVASPHSHQHHCRCSCQTQPCTAGWSTPQRCKCLAQHWPVCRSCHRCRSRQCWCSGRSATAGARGFREEGGGEISSTGGVMAYAWVTPDHWWAAAVRCSSSCRHSSQPHLTTISIIAIAVGKPSLALQGGAHPSAASAWLSIGRCAGLATGAAVGCTQPHIHLQQQVHRV
jgi:hypothetical protein